MQRRSRAAGQPLRQQVRAPLSEPCCCAGVVTQTAVAQAFAGWPCRSCTHTTTQTHTHAHLLAAQCHLQRSHLLPHRHILGLYCTVYRWFNDTLHRMCSLPHVFNTTTPNNMQFMQPIPGSRACACTPPAAALLSLAKHQPWRRCRTCRPVCSCYASRPPALHQSSPAPFPLPVACHLATP
jgi:hypothetical protein